MDQKFFLCLVLMKVKTEYKAVFEHKASLEYKTVEAGWCLIFGHYFLISLKNFFIFFFSVNLTFCQCFIIFDSGFFLC